MKRLFDYLRGKRMTTNAKLRIPERINAVVTSSKGNRVLIG